jgi:hypothetical protein
VSILSTGWVQYRVPLAQRVALEMDLMLQSDVFSAFRSETTRRHSIFPPGLGLPTDAQVYSTLAPPPLPPRQQLRACAACDVVFPVVGTEILCVSCKFRIDWPAISESAHTVAQRVDAIRQQRVEETRLLRQRHANRNQRLGDTFQQHHGERR